MKKEKGIALISGLLIMVAIMALGVGSLFLTDMNLKISENARSNSIAKYHAEAGLDTALAILADEYENKKAFPTKAELESRLSVKNGQSYNLLAYQAFAQPARAMVRVEGTTDNNGRFVAEALFQSDIYRAFEKGLVTDGRIDLSGGGTAEFLNAGMHANKGVVKLSGYSAGVFTECPWGVLPGSSPPKEGCLSATTTATPTPVTSSNNTTCVSLCSDNNAKPVVIAPQYFEKRNQAIRESHVVGGQQSMNNSTQAIMKDTHNNVMRCTTVLNGTQTLTAAQVQAAGPVICVQNNAGSTNPNVGALNLPADVNLSGITIIADGHITFGNPVTSTSTTVPANGAAGTLTDVKLISKNGGVMLNKVVGTNLSIFSGANRDFGSTQPNKPPTFVVSKDFNLWGYTTIASSEHIEFDGRSNVTSRPNASDAVTVAIISEKNITNGGSFDFFGIFWAGGTFTQSGKSTIYGGVVTVGDISTSGVLKINSSYAVDNDHLLGDTIVLSRR